MKKLISLASILTIVFITTGCTQKTIGVSEYMTYNTTNVNINELKVGEYCDEDVVGDEIPTVGLAAKKGDISTVYIVDQEVRDDKGRCVKVYGK